MIFYVELNFWLILAYSVWKKYIWASILQQYNYRSRALLCIVKSKPIKIHVEQYNYIDFILLLWQIS